MRQTTGIIILEGLTGLVLLIGLGLGLIAWRLVSGPTDLEFVRGNVEAEISRARGGQPVSVGALSLRWQHDQNEFQILADELVFYNDTDEVVARADSATIEFDAFSLLVGQVELQELHIRDGEFEVRRPEDGGLKFAGQAIPPVYPVQFHEATSPFQYAEQAILNVVENLANSAAVANVDEITLSGFRVRLIDEGSDVEWVLENANLSLVQDDDTIGISGFGEATGDGAPQSLEFDLEFIPRLREFRTVLSLQDANIPELPVLVAILPDLSGTLVADLSFAFEVRQSGIDIVSVDVSSQPGELLMGEDLIEIGANSLLVEYDIERDVLFVDAREIDTEFALGSLQLQLDQVTNLLEDPLAEPHAISLDAEALQFDFTPYFSDIWQIQNVRAEALVDLRRRQMDVLDMTAFVDGAQAYAQGRIYLPDDNALPDDLPFGISMTATVDGAFTPETVLKFWPVTLGADARLWVEENVREGDFSEAQFRMDLAPDELRDDRLDDEDLQLDFVFENAVTSFLEDLPSVNRGRGSARLNGNSFSLDLESGEFSNWTLTAGKVSIPQFKPKGENFYIDAEGFGDVQDILQTLSDSRLQLEAQYGLNIQDITGSGQAHFSLIRPALSEVSYEDTRFTVEGEITDGGFRELFNEMSLTGSQADIHVSNELLRISGYGQFGDAPMEFTWSDRFREEGAEDRSTLRASGYVSPDFINRFGVAIRTYMTGSAYAELDAFGTSAENWNLINIALDFKESRLDVEEFSWFKPIGEPANAVVRVITEEEEQTTEIAFIAEGVDFQGDVSLSADGRLEDLSVDRIYIEDELDLRGELRRPDPLTLELELTGPYLNAAPLLEGVLNAGGAGGSGTLPIFGEVTLDANIDRLQLRNDLQAQDATMRVDFSGPRLNSFELAGLLELDNPFVLSIQGLDDGNNQLTAQASNAGGLISAVLGHDFVTGGELSMNGIMRADEQPSDLNITLRNARMANAPLLTQILSLASLRGLSDVMSGEGVLFSNVELPLTLTPEGFYIRGGKASGPALGLTANGHMLDDGEDLQISGVLVPSFGVNSALGGIPIIGDLFVSREGEGVFAITYDVRGSLEEARVSVNPLSGIVPGVLRRVFENPEAPVPQPEEVTEPEELEPVP